MSEREVRPDSLEAGHRLSTRKPPASKAPTAVKSAKSSRSAKPAKPAKVKGQKNTGPSFRQRLSGLSGPLGAPVRLVKRGAGKAWGVWDRGYDAAVARPVHAVKVFGIVVAVLAVIAGLIFYHADHYARLDAARADAVKQGEGAVGRLMSYSFRTSGRQVEKTEDLVTGKFKDDYAQFINSKVIPGARDKQINVQTSVDRSAVISSSLSEAVLVMYIDVESEALLGFDAGSSTGALRVTLKEEDGRWKVSDLTPV
jgi:Mce-associated membrane protein